MGNTTTLDTLRSLLPKPKTIGVSGPTEYVPNENLRADDRVKVAPFPYREVFDGRIVRIVEDCHQYLSYPHDFTAAAILSAAAIAIARTWKIQYQWEETATLYMALVAPPGTAKTHPLLFALYPMIEADKKAIREYNLQRRKLEQAEDVDADKMVDRQRLFGDFTI